MTPIRFSLAEKFLKSARDMGNAEMIKTAIRVWNGVNFPRTHPMTDADRAMFLGWQNWE